MKIKATNYRRLTINDLSMEGCMNFLMAFCEEIGKEYTIVYNRYLDNPRDPGNVEHYKKIRKYLCSNYFTKLTNLDGKGIADSLERQCKKDRNTSRWNFQYQEVI